MINEKLIRELLGEETLSVKELRAKNEEAFEGIAPIKLANFLMKQDYIKTIEIRGNKPNKYKIIPVIELTGVIEKDKNLLKIQTIDNDYIIYDFNKEDFINNDITIDKNIKQINYNPIITVFFDDYYAPFREIEWLYNYPDLINDSTFKYKYDIDIFSRCPSGYINWLRENSLYINRNSLRDYIFKAECSNIPPQLKKEYFIWYDLETLRSINNIFAKCNIRKLMKNSINNFELNIKKDLTDFINICIKLENFINYVDENRSLEYNTNALKNIYNKDKNILLAKKLQKLNFLNNIIIDNYIVVVPQKIEDLQNEGKQQHNCVGHYYNDSIIEGKNLIYFLRKKDNPNKSVVTCRYHLASKNTQEHRIINNMSTNPEQNAIINQIDKIIRENLKSVN